MSIRAARSCICRFYSQGPRNLTQKISAMKSQHIRLLGLRASMLASDYIGLIGSNQAAQCVAAYRMSPKYVLEPAVIFPWCLRAEHQEKTVGAPSCLEKLPFILALSCPIIKRVEESVSNPAQFVENGVEIQLSDVEPEGILKDTAQKLGVRLRLSDVPPEFSVHVGIALRKTEQQKKIVFSFLAKSQGVVFFYETCGMQSLKHKLKEIWECHEDKISLYRTV